MTPHQLLFAWLLGPLALVVALLAVGRFAPEPARRFDGAPVAAIGSSLSVHAMPAHFRLRDGREVRRIGISVASESDSLTLLEAGIDEHARLILLEAAPFVADFAFEQPKGCQAPARGLRQELRAGQVRLVDRLRRLFGEPASLDGMREPVGLDRAQEIDPVVMATFYPLTIHPPCEGERLARAVARAKAQGIRIVLLVPPRSPFGERLLGNAQSQQLTLRTRELANRLGLDLLEFGAGWSDAEFVDHAHVNARGRARFLRQLDAWLGAAR
ncbi:MAG: hypothetical protein U1E37_10000 [Sphingomonadaceae bacterium]